VAPSDASLSARARGKLAVLDEVRRRWDRVHSLIEQIYAHRTAVPTRTSALFQSGQDPLGTMMRKLTRMSAETGQLLSDRGFALLAEDVQHLLVLARLGGMVQVATLNRMKELVALGYDGIEHTARRVREDDRDEDLIRRAL